MPDPDPLAAELAAIRRRADQITGDHEVADDIADLGAPCTGHDAERLADVVGAVLDLAQGWEGNSGKVAGVIIQSAIGRELLTEEGEPDA
jgi:hypothetical protein